MRRFCITSLAVLVCALLAPLLVISPAAAVAGFGDVDTQQYFAQPLQFDEENISGCFVGAFTRVQISQYSWQDDWLSIFIRCTNNNRLEVYCEDRITREGGGELLVAGASESLRPILNACGI